ncbi:MAG: hypothetical protein H7Z15_14795 [Rhizobacter sp.]|nr:hypothetical protein [Rhizobacter sp.]
MTGLAITEVSLSCSLGLDSAEACAAARAGLVRTSPVGTLNSANDPAMAKETLDGIPPLVVHTTPVVSDGYTGLGKLIAIGRPALQDLLKKAGLVSTEHAARTGLCLCVSDDHFVIRFGERLEPLGEQAFPSQQETRQEIADQLAQRLSATVEWVPHLQWATASGRLGLLSALAQASRWLKKGEVDRCIVGLLDSLVEPAVLQACANGRVLKSEAQPVGFMPGEAAAFLLVEQDIARAPGTTTLRLSALAHDRDFPYHDDEQQPLGRALSGVMQRALSSSQAELKTIPPVVIADLNGTEARAMDWGHALVHLRERYGEFDSSLWLPVESFGETGAATGGVAMCMALEAARRGHLPGGGALLVLCAENGGRAAMLLDAQAAEL